MSSAEAALMRTRYQSAALAALVVSAALMTAGAAPAVAAYPDQIRKAAAGSQHFDSLAGVAAISRRDAWAVGCKQDRNGSCTSTLIEHWNGRKWSTTRSPNPGHSDGLNSISATSRDNAWAVGGYSGGALALRWNGHRWRRVPTASQRNARLDSVAAISRTNAWAVGCKMDQNGLSCISTLIEHWNGTQWLRVPSPNPPGGAVLAAVTAISPDNIWAVGEHDNGAAVLTLVEHWNGSSWTRVPAKNPGGTGESFFTGVSASSPGDVWAVGVRNSDPQDFAPDRTLTEHWNGSSWQVVPSPNPGKGALGNTLNDVAAISAKDAWAVGDFQGSAHDLLLAEHWNGRKWRTVPILYPAGPKPFFDLFGITALSASNAWAVGENDPNFLTPGLRTVIVHWNGAEWTRAASPNP